jgi:hypothetical protein
MMTKISEFILSLKYISKSSISNNLEGFIHRVKENEENSTSFRIAPQNVEDRKRERKEEVGGYNGICNHKKPVPIDTDQLTHAQ